ncbi:hypothetical protein DNTS_016232 [Danionella cerebrum]|uniref:PDZ domain-containing protein n=1 Tax=Danionella cerebrum TaxID=2873325 RepID=A0A553Q0M6_9TELE|nr:hypothetical protein DNTS_016232 [Danionella translucida]
MIKSNEVMNHTQGTVIDSSPEELRRLQKNIQQWNLTHLSLFEITEPDEESVFHGVVRFYLQDHSSGNDATKCMCISSSLTTQDVIETLLEKFQHNTNPSSYSLYEVFNSKEERKLNLSEKPLVVQLSWNKERGGRFILRDDNCMTFQNGGVGNKNKVGLIENFRRTLSRKDKNKNKQKKKEETNSMKQADVNTKLNLPLSIALKGKDEDSFLLAVINDINSSTIHFNLSPAYVFYLLGRFLISKAVEKSKPGQYEQRVGSIQDGDLGPITIQAQYTLARLVQATLRYLTHRLQAELENHSTAFFAHVNKEGTQANEIEGVLNTLIKTMSLLRRCRVNPALSIQLFSQLFHFMGSWILNRVTAPESTLCSNYWGKIIRQRLRHVEIWAERQGLELAVDCYLSKIIQATMLLTMTSYSIRDAQKIQSMCYKLNSLQLRALMSNYHYSPKQPRFPPGLIENVVALAESKTDILRAEEAEICLKEELDLHLPFLLPEDGYSCDTMHGVPKGFQEFLEPICCKGLCKLVSHSNAGTWTVFFSSAEKNDTNNSAWKSKPVEITLRKALQSGIGVSIVAAKGAEQEELGIFVKSIVKGGVANLDGRLNPGDQILSVDGKTLVGVTQERAAELMIQTGSVVTLEVVRSAGMFYGFEGVFAHTSPTECKDPIAKGTSKEILKVCDLHERAEPIVSGSARASGAIRNLHTSTRPSTKQNQTLLKKKLEFRSNPNLTNNKEMSVDSVANEKLKLSFSTESLMDSGNPRNTEKETDVCPREYQTLPTSKLKSNKAPGTTVPPQDQHKINFMKQARSQDDIYREGKGHHLQNKPRFLKKQLEMSRWNSLATLSPVDCGLSCMEHRQGLWKIPKTTQSVPISQPKRVDVPYSPEDHKLSFSTFRQPSQAMCSSQTLHSHQYHISALAQQRTQSKEVVSQFSGKNMRLSQSLHVESQQKRHEKSSKLLTTDQLEQEVHSLQVKVHRSMEESQRLSRLSLELQFQRKLQDFQINSEEEDLMGSVAEGRSFQTACSVVPNCDRTNAPMLKQDENKRESERANNNYSDDLNKYGPETQQDPENLTFMERRRLFSMPVVPISNIKVS